MAERRALPKPGDLVASKYRIKRTLGVGGLGVVFEAAHAVTGRRFAIKWLLPEVAAHSDSVERFVREARFAGGLEHPNVIDVYDVCEEDDALFMVMEFLEGESLAERLTRLGRFTEAETLRILLPCMRGVARAHAAGIVHRDLKPANLFICAATPEQPERFKVLDFGISKIVSSPGEMVNTLTNSGALMGTPFYMSPEQMRGRTVDHRADVYSFGVILYQMLSGQLPFSASTFGDLVLQVLTEKPPPLGELAPATRRELIDCIERAMARAPEDRYDSMVAFVQALEPFAQSAAATSSPPAQAPISAAPAAPAAATPSRPIEAVQPRAAERDAQLTPLSTESQPPPAPKAMPVTPRRGLRPLWIAAIAAACATGIGVVAYWLSPVAEVESERPQHVVQPKPESPETTTNAARGVAPPVPPPIPQPSVAPVEPATTPARILPLPAALAEPARSPQRVRPEKKPASRPPTARPTAAAPPPRTTPVASPPPTAAAGKAPEEAKQQKKKNPGVRINLDTKQF